MSIEKIKEKLQVFDEVEIIDNSAQHMHEEGFNLSVRIIDDKFTGKSLIERHQMVYKVLAEEMKK